MLNLTPDQAVVVNKAHNLCLTAIHGGDLNITGGMIFNEHACIVEFPHNGKYIKVYCDARGVIKKVLIEDHSGIRDEWSGNSAQLDK